MKNVYLPGASWSEAEPDADVRVMESRVHQSRRQRGPQSGAVRARLVPRRRAGAAHVHPTGKHYITQVNTTSHR